MAVLTYKWSNFLRGEGISDFASSGGFSPSSIGINLNRTPGVIYFNEAQTDRTGSGTLTDDVIAHTDDLNFSGNDKYLVDDSGGVYTYDDTTLTKRQTISTDGGNMTYGTTDILQFKSVTYITTDDAVHQLTGSNLATTANWWDGLGSNHRHPLESVEDEMFIGDGNIIYFWNGTNSGKAFTLPTQNRVTTLRKHSDGKTLLAFTGKTDNHSHTEPSTGRVYYCDPNLRDWTREVELEAQVEGSRVVGGVIFTTYGKNLGFFDGNGLQFLKKLETSETTYSHSLYNLEDILLVRDGRNVLAYGDLGLGNIFWKIARNSNANNLNIVTHVGNNVLLLGGTGTDLESLDLDNAGADGQLYTPREYFDQEVDVHKIEIFHDTASTYTLNVNYVDLADTQNVVETIIYTGESIEKSTIQTDIRTDIFQLLLAPSNGSIGIKFIRIHYDPVV